MIAQSPQSDGKSAKDKTSTHDSTDPVCAFLRLIVRRCSSPRLTPDADAFPVGHRSPETIGAPTGPTSLSIDLFDRPYSLAMCRRGRGSKTRLNVAQRIVVSTRQVHLWRKPEITPFSDVGIRGVQKIERKIQLATDQIVTAKDVLNSSRNSAARGTSMFWKIWKSRNLI